jgi:hypothetical protein
MRKIAEETLRKRQAESVIQQMEQEERNLISRLRRTQHMQEQVRPLYVHCTFVACTDVVWLFGFSLLVPCSTLFTHVATTSHHFPPCLFSVVQAYAALQTTLRS